MSGKCWRSWEEEGRNWKGREMSRSVYLLGSYLSPPSRYRTGQDRTTGNGQAVSIITSIVPVLYLYLPTSSIFWSRASPYLLYCYYYYYTASITIVYYTPTTRIDTTAACVPHRWFYPNRKSASQLHYRPFPAGSAAGPSALSHRVVPLSCHPHGTHAFVRPCCLLYLYT